MKKTLSIFIFGLLFATAVHAQVESIGWYLFKTFPKASLVRTADSEQHEGLSDSFTCTHSSQRIEARSYYDADNNEDSALLFKGGKKIRGCDKLCQSLNRKVSYSPELHDSDYREMAPVTFKTVSVNWKDAKVPLLEYLTDRDRLGSDGTYKIDEYKRKNLKLLHNFKKFCGLH